MMVKLDYYGVKLGGIVAVRCFALEWQNTTTPKADQ